MQQARLPAGGSRLQAARSCRQTPVVARRVQRRQLVCRASTAQEQFPAQVCVVLGTQWGDEGKGKLVDILAQQYDVVARAQASSSSRRAGAPAARRHATLAQLALLALSREPETPASAVPAAAQRSASLLTRWPAVDARTHACAARVPAGWRQRRPHHLRRPRHQVRTAPRAQRHPQQVRGGCCRGQAGPMAAATRTRLAAARALGGVQPAWPAAADLVAVAASAAAACGATLRRRRSCACMRAGLR